MKLWPYTWHDDKPEEFGRLIDNNKQDWAQKAADDITRERERRKANEMGLLQKWVDRANVAKAYGVPLLIDEDTWADLLQVLSPMAWNPYDRRATFGGVQVLVPFDGGGKLE